MRHLLPLLLLAWACDDDKSAEPTRDAAAATDGGPVDAVQPDAAVPDASLKLQCACSDGPEDCEACFRLISRCCNEGEETFGGRIGYLLATCRGDPNCESCCDECANRTCDQVVRAGDCPVQP